MHARAIRFSFSLAPLISLCSRMWAESCIPNTKNNHFGGSGGGAERGVWVCRWAEVAVSGRTHSSQASDLTAATVEGEEERQQKVQYIFCKASPENVKCPIPILFSCIQSWPGAEQLKGDFYLPRYFNQRLSKSAHIRRGTTIQTCRRGNTEANVKLMT